jgi:hypothetical protein
MLGTAINKSNFRNIKRNELSKKFDRLYMQIQKIRYYILTRVFFKGYAFVHLRFNVFQITFQQLHSN